MDEPRRRGTGTPLADWERQFIADHARAGHSKSWVARELHVSINTVRRYWLVDTEKR